MDLLQELLLLINYQNPVIIDSNDFYQNVGDNHVTDAVGYQIHCFPDRKTIVFKLAYVSNASSTIYYFPFKPILPGSIPGYCIAPINTCQIITSPMNGCSIEIFRVQENANTHYLFLHNGNEYQLNMHNNKNNLSKEIRNFYPRSTVSIDLDHPELTIKSSDYMIMDETVQAPFWIPIIHQLRPRDYDVYFFCFSLNKYTRVHYLYKKCSRLITIRNHHIISSESLNDIM